MKINENFYPIWHHGSHGPACSAEELAELYADALGNVPTDVISFIDEENLVARLQLLGWKAIAGSAISKAEGRA